MSPDEDELGVEWRQTNANQLASVPRFHLTLLPACIYPNAHTLYIMYHLLKGLHAHLTRKDEYSVVIIGLDNVSSILFMNCEYELMDRLVKR